MNKAHFFSFLFFLSIVACQSDQSKVLPASTGAFNTISVVMNNDLWNGEVGDSLRKKIAAPILGLPQEEPLFTLNQYSDKFVEGFITDSRNIVIIKKGVTPKFDIQFNRFAIPQTLIHISGSNSKAIVKVLEENAPKMVATLKKGEIIAEQKRQKAALLNPKIFANKFQIQLSVPSTYKYALQKPRFIWLKREITSGSLSLLLYQVPLETIPAKNPIAGIIAMRDSIGKLYIKGRENQSPMQTGKGYAPYWMRTKLANCKAFEVKGNWELKNDFMSGPFINYTIFDPEYNRIMVLEGFCYAPAEEKRDLMFELEAIIKSVQIIKRENL